jgi:carbon-monoxide dehydrogenase large subunit
VDVSRARAIPGVIGVWTGEDLVGANVGNLPAFWSVDGLRAALRPPLANDFVRHVGEAVAIVVAESGHIERDAADRVEVEYSPIPATGDARAALARDAPLIHNGVPSNLALEWRAGQPNAVDAALAAAAHVVEQRIVIPRIAAIALEPRACTATYRAATGTLTLRAPLQAPHLARSQLARTLGLPEQRIRVLTGDVGGAFGSRLSLGPEEIAVCFAAMRSGRPVHWAGDRREAFHSDAQSRDAEILATLAFDADHRAVALRIRSMCNLGAYATSIAPALPTVMFTSALPGPYDIDAWDARVSVAYTNTVPAGAVRGAGRQEACFAIERVFDIAAGRFGINPVDLRRLSLSRDAGEADRLRMALDRAVQRADAHNEQRRQHPRHDGPRALVGTGYALYVDACAPAPDVAIGPGRGIGLYGRAEVRVQPDGGVTVLTDGTDQGQNHAAMYARVVASVLGIAETGVSIESDDSTAMPAGAGTVLGRGAAIVSRAILEAAQDILAQAKRIAAQLLDAPESGIQFSGALFQAGQTTVSLADVASRAYAASEDRAKHGLFARAEYDAEHWTRTSGAHCAIVRVDADTGNTELLLYIAIDDIGAIDDVGVRDMLEGGIAQGIGQVLLERIAHDENGQLLTTSFMDYAVPRFDNIPVLEIHPLEEMADGASGTWNARSAGSAGAIAAPAAIANAIHAAVARFGVEHIDPPLTPARIWEAIHEAEEREGR